MSKSVMTTEEFREKINSLYPNKYNIIGEYSGANNNIEVQYNGCGHIINQKVAYIRQGYGCPVCHPSKKLTNDEFKHRFHKIFGDELEIQDEYINMKQNIRIKHISCGTIFPKNVASMFAQNRCECPTCNPNSSVFLIPGVNDIHTTNKELELLLKDPEDAFKYTQNSNKKIWFICPDCGNELLREISNVNAYGLKCERCNIKQSYGERFMANLLSELKIKYQFQYSPKWIHPYVFDFYFNYNNTDYIVEIDGIHHFKSIKNTQTTLGERIRRDLYKQNLAEKRNYKVIRIDYNYDKVSKREEYLINSIHNSLLNDLFDLQNYNFNNIIILTETPLIKLAVDLWNSYDIKALRRISEDLEISYERARRLLYRASDLNMINESHEDIKKLNRKYRDSCMDVNNATRVLCVETGEIFRSFNEANKKYHAALTGYFLYGYKYSGTLSDGTHLTWKKV